jgi:hypothetical protein
VTGLKFEFWIDNTFNLSVLFGDRNWFLSFKCVDKFEFENFVLLINFELDIGIEWWDWIFEFGFVNTF